MQFTKDQEKVITTRDKNILVAAAAGSGKTAVLVERILGRITDTENPIDIDRLLIVTFTNAAASEMRQRIHKGIMKRLSVNPNDRNLQKQATLVHNSMIMTIDSFCLFLLKNHFQEIDLDPSFRIGDPGEIKLIENEVLENVLEICYDRAEPDFIALSDVFCTDGKKDKLEELILQLYHAAESHPWPDLWLEECKEEMLPENMNEENIFTSLWMKYAKQLVIDGIQDILTLNEKALAICDLPDGPYMYAEMLESDHEVFERFTHAESFKSDHDWDAKQFDMIKSALSAISFKSLSTKKDATVSGEKRDMVKELRTQYKKIKDTLSGSVFKYSFTETMDREVKTASLMSVLLEVTLEFRKAFFEEKLKRGVLDFADVEHLALLVLIKKEDAQNGQSNYALTQTALNYRDYFEEIMTDEYQDSNMVQELLLASISRTETPNRFMVGDMKQSIYKFRLARPEIFMDKYTRYQTEQKDNTLICLKKNFRSRREVLDSVNAIFQTIMHKEVGGVEYDDNAALYVGADYPVPNEKDGDFPRDIYQTELCIYQKSGEDILKKREGEFYLIAEKIKEMKGSFPVTETVRLSDGTEEKRIRSAKYKDMVILIRSGEDVALRMSEILSSQGIPVYLESSSGYFQAWEIKQMMAFLKVIENPYEDISFCMVAESYYGIFSDEELALIRAFTDKKLSVYESFRAFAGFTGEKICSMAAESEMEAKGLLELQLKAETFLAEIEDMRQKSCTMDIPDLLSYILKISNFSEYALSMPAGAQKKSNLDMLLQKAVDFEKTSYHGLFQFIHYMEQLQKYEVDYGEASTVAETADVVRIMTIHKSKGLEFPICFVTGLDKRYNLKDMSKPVLTDADWGIASDYIDISKMLKGSTLRKDMFAQKQKRESIGEELRVLYVALTRAKEKLIMTGITDDLERKQKAYEFLKMNKEDSQEGNQEGVWEGNQKDDQKCDKKRTIPVSMLSNTIYPLDFVLMGCVVSDDFIKISVYSQDDLAIVQEENEDERAKRKEEIKTLWEESKSGNIEKDFSEELKQHYELLKDRFSFVYPHKNLEGLYTKTSVSELKHAAIEREEGVHVIFETDKEEEVYLPAFARKEKQVNEGAKRGSAFHRCLELIDFADYLLKGRGDDEIEAKLKEDIDTFTKEGKMEAEDASLISIKKIITFLKSDVALRMAKAQKKGMLYKEQAFILSVPAKRLNEEFPEEENVLIQGIIDVFFEEEGEIVILDYKTDKVETLEKLKNRYETQLDYYDEAAGRILGKKVKEKILYSFALLDTISWNGL